MQVKWSVQVNRSDFGALNWQDCSKATVAETQDCELTLDSRTNFTFPLKLQVLMIHDQIFPLRPLFYEILLIKFNI